MNSPPSLWVISRACRRITAACSRMRRRSRENSDSFLSPPAEASAKFSMRSPKMGYEPLPADSIIRNWFTGEYFSLKSENARGDLDAILPAILDALARSGSPETALLACDRFFSELAEGARLFAALRTHPDLVELIALILGTAPRLGDIVAHSPSLLDGLLDPAFFGVMPSEAVLTERLNALLSDARNRGGGFRSLAPLRPRTNGADRRSRAFRRRVRESGRGCLCDARRCADPRAASRDGKPFRRDLWPSREFANGRSRARETRRPRNDGGLRSRPPSPLRIRSGATRIEWRAQARRQPVLRPLHQASHQRAHDAHQRRQAIRCRYAPSAFRPLGSGRDFARKFRRISAQGSVDVGAHGADARARGFGGARFSRKDRSVDRRSALHETRSAQDRRRHPGDARADREG